MKLAEYEQALLSAILQHPPTIKILAPELTADKFGYGSNGEEGGGHRLIYQAAVSCHLKAIPPDVISVERELADKIEIAGGVSYLRQLVTILPTLGVRVINENSVRNWARVVDNLGRLRELSRVVTSYSDMLIDKEKALREIEDVDVFIAELIAELWKAQGTINTDYQHISIGIGDFRRRLEQELRGKSISIPEIGWPSFRSASLPFMGGLTVIAGLPGAGKTQLALQIMLGQIIQAKRRGAAGCVAINSYEMTSWRIVSRLACCLASVDSSLLRTGKIKEHSEDAKRLMEWTEFLEDLPIYIDDSNLTTSARINWQSSALHAINGPLLHLVVDYAEKVPMSDTGERDSRERQVASTFTNVVNIAKTTNACGTVLSQFNNSVLFNKSKIAGAGALRYGGAGWQAADVQLEVWNPISMRANQIDFVTPDHLTDDAVWVMVEKYRDGPAGTVFPLHWEPTYTRFSDPMLSQRFGSDLYEGLSELTGRDF